MTRREITEPLAAANPGRAGGGGAGLTGVLRRTGVLTGNRCVSSLEHTRAFKVGKREVCNETAEVQRAPR